MKQAINTRTQEEYDALMRYFESKGITWATGEKATALDFWRHLYSEMCLYVDHVGLTYNHRIFYENGLVPIIPYTEFAKTIKPERDYEAMFNEAKGLVENALQCFEALNPFSLEVKEYKQALKRWEDGE